MGNGECLNSAESEEASLLAFKTSRTFNLSKWFSGFGISACFNDRGHFFPCGDGQCCGNSCKAKGDLCCRNSLGDSFPCQKGGECCGNACAAPGSKCCNKGKPGYEYPVAKGTACTSEYSVTCREAMDNSFSAARAAHAAVTSVLGPATLAARVRVATSCAAETASAVATLARPLEASAASPRAWTTP